ncbi:MAG TPA: T9SS type A sorting domain-containing protein [Bacteroidales bacterium]|nr:T9SS type A sorting domain-containing protein [Bacteroidales bacterium]
MKAKFTLTLFSLLIIAVLFPKGAQADPMTVTFPTLGNCYLCQLRIEAAVNDLAGIDTVSWNYETKITTVTYNDQVTDPFIIMDAIARVGHDTEWFPAPDSAYNALIGTCCEYERTMDYTNVQVGYLSLMDLWVFHVGISDLRTSAEISVYPSAGTGMFHIDISGANPGMIYELSVFSMSGSLVHNAKVSSVSDNSLDLSRLVRGQYIVILQGNGNLIARTKLIKI